MFTLQETTESRWWEEMGGREAARVGRRETKRQGGRKEGEEGGREACGGLRLAQIPRSVNPRLAGGCGLGALMQPRNESQAVWCFLPSTRRSEDRLSNAHRRLQFQLTKIETTVRVETVRRSLYQYKSQSGDIRRALTPEKAMRKLKRRAETLRSRMRGRVCNTT